MNKLLYCIALLSFALMLGCNSAPKAAPAPSGSNTTAQGSDSYRAATDRYKQGLILDGAGTYKVVHRDTLSRISQLKYKNGFYFPVIMLASSDLVLDPDKIIPGWVLTIPDLEANLKDPRARENIKQFLLEVAKINDQRNRPRDAAGLRALSASL